MANILVVEDDVTTNNLVSGYLAEKDGEPVELAPKEIQLLKLLVENAGRVMTREKLIDGVCTPCFIS